MGNSGDRVADGSREVERAGTIQDNHALRWEFSFEMLSFIQYPVHKLRSIGTTQSTVPPIVQHVLGGVLTLELS